MPTKRAPRFRALPGIYAGYTVGRQFQYIGKFCFSWTPTLNNVAGRIAGEIETNVNGLQVAIYDDEARFWNYVMTDSSCDCYCKVSPRHTKGVFNVTATNTHQVTPFSFNVDIHEHLRPRFWYVALARCVPGGDTYKPSFAEITESNFRKYYFSSWYKIHMTQGDGGELPVQQQGMPAIYAVMTALSGAAAAAQIVAARRMRHSESFHPIMKLLTMVVLFFFLCNALLFLHFSTHQFNGLGVPFFKYAAKITEVFVRVALPIIVLIASFLSPWVREKTVVAITTSVDCTIYLTLIYMLWPSRAPRYFERLYSVSSPSEKESLRDQHLPTEEL
ncbi:hypothetical protein BBO99_00000644 [Phytophthora kernoviae]|uniref:Uncharacterized protein n=2 Tax=Phytophthora kernoviae TaxID=325452 RepID=A0A421FEV1_9STRA|nr:hypothetical protein G195_001651 [Phytophthora kernoviae 00238/432]KAG2530735.1 hypothetical protein JM16_001476 [Phytophthora kernoviae]KAG2532882.1 hypothetical protein JM18_000882 [Phytophthora kernoviae]RLN43785.1 hypothetical protein BBI17_001461 [Phytophthora kernoviae]RLN85368.1 hypothetical protein BBO99_00000644 [Phytophthora kernoviae]